MSEKSKFEELAAIDVSAKIEKKNGLSYLSWAWAVDTLLRADPNASWEYGEPKLFAETMMVYCTVQAFGKYRTAHLPVMDHRNQPIKNPNSFQINTAMQRALVKAIALHGLGLYIYAGEDLPPSDEEKPKKEREPIPAKNKLGVRPIKAESPFSEDRVRAVEEVVKKVLNWIGTNDLQDAVLEKENHKLSIEEQVLFWSYFDSKQRRLMKEAHEELKAKYQTEKEAA